MNPQILQLLVVLGIFLIVILPLLRASIKVVQEYERGVPVVEISLSGWDTHGNAAEATKRVINHAHETSSLLAASALALCSLDPACVVGLVLAGPDICLAICRDGR